MCACSYGFSGRGLWSEETVVLQRVICQRVICGQAGEGVRSGHCVVLMMVGLA